MEYRRKVNAFERKTGQSISEATAVMSVLYFQGCKFLDQLRTKKIATTYNFAFRESNVVEDLDF